MIRKALSVFMIAAILAPCLLVVPGLARDDPPKAHPGLLQLAKDHPDTRLPVIVQRDSSKNDLPDESPEAILAKGGGQVKKQLKMIDSFSAELSAKELEKFAKSKKVRWVSLDAPLFSSATIKTVVADSFPGIDFTGNTGNIAWSTPWQELGESDGSETGIIQVGASLCSSGYCLLFNSTGTKSVEGRGVMRQADLSHAVAATLSYTYRRASANGTTGNVKVQVSKDGGVSWVTLATYNLNASDSSAVSQSYNILSYAAADTRVRIIGGGTANRNIAFDNIQIDYSVNSSLETPFGFSSVRDDFTGAYYTLSSGTQPWLSAWSESDNKTGGSTGGNIKVTSSTTCAGNAGYCLYVSNLNLGDNIYRSADLSNATNPRLSFWRNNLLAGLNNNDSVILEVSTDGANWTTLRVWRDVLDDLGPGYETFSLNTYISANTRIRFRIASRTDIGYILFDNIQIQYTGLKNSFNQAINADRLWLEPPYLDGEGVTVAVLDSGFSNKADFQVYAGGASRIQAAVNFGGTNTDTNDLYGHGTLVTSILAGNGSATGRARPGVAPGVHLVNVKASDANGLSYGSDMIEGLEWIYNNRAAYNIKVVNISMNSSVPESYLTSPICAAVEILWLNGITVVVSAGNNGSTNPGVLLPPANDPFVITVGAIDNNQTPELTDDHVALFSAFGTTEDGFAKPDLMAPGRNIISLLAGTNARLYLDHPEARVDDIVFRASGTSMSAPMVTGAVALLLQDEPGLTPDQVKYRLMATANKNWGGYSAAKAGAGYLDVYAAIHGLTTQSANIGLEISTLLGTGTEPVDASVSWNSVSWNSVSWNSVSWNSVSWNSVSWNSVSWNSDYWGQ